MGTTIKRCKDHALAVALANILEKQSAFRAWDCNHPFVKELNRRLLQPFEGLPPSMDDLLRGCVCVVHWLWDETHQQLVDNSPLELFLARLPLTPEYLAALRSGGAAAARNLAMPIMIQMGSVTLSHVGTGTEIMHERCIAPCQRLRRLTAECIQSCLDKWMPLSPIRECALFHKVTCTYFVLCGDGASSNGRLKRFNQWARKARVNVLNDNCRAHRVNLSNHDQLGVLNHFGSTDDVTPGPVGAGPALAPPAAPAAAAEAAPGGRGRARGGRGGRGGRG